MHRVRRDMPDVHDTDCVHPTGLFLEVTGAPKFSGDQDGRRYVCCRIWDGMGSTNPHIAFATSLYSTCRSRNGAKQDCTPSCDLPASVHARLCPLAPSARTSKIRVCRLLSLRGVMILQGQGHGFQVLPVSTHSESLAADARCGQALSIWSCLHSSRSTAKGI